MIKAIIFDFFGVLVTEGFKQFRETHFADDKDKEKEAINLINRVDSGLMPTEEFTTQLAKLAGITPNEVHQQLGSNKPNRPLLSYIAQDLKGKYALSILSNSSEDYPGKLLDKEDLDLFDDILLSYRHGMIKPQSEIYELAAKRLNVSLHEAVFIDDSPGHSDGAKKAGMKAMTYKDFPQFKADLETLLK